MAIILEENIKILEEKIKKLRETINHAEEKYSVEKQETLMMDMIQMLKESTKQLQESQYQEDLEDEALYLFKKEDEQDQIEEANKDLKEEQQEMQKALVEATRKTKPNTIITTPTNSPSSESLASQKKMSMKFSKKIQLDEINIDKSQQEFEADEEKIFNHVLEPRDAAGKDLGGLKNAKGDDSSAFIKTEEGAFEKFSNNPSMLNKNNLMSSFAPNFVPRPSNDDKNEYDNAFSYYSTPTYRPTGA